jgi:hypothetical protein
MFARRPDGRVRNPRRCIRRGVALSAEACASIVETKLRRREMQMPQSARGGTVLRGSDGSLYFIRDELLEKLRIDDDGSERIQSVVGESKAKAGARVATSEVLGYVSGDLLKDQPAGKSVPAVRAKSTYMCPWFCSSVPK